MNSVLNFVLLLVLFVQLEARNAGKIKQCECDKLMECRKEARKRETPCIDRCKSKLENDNWDKEQGLKCFDQPENTDHHQCMHAIALQTCTNDPNVMINRNGTLPWGHRRHHRRPRAIDDAENAVDSEKHEEENHQHRPREHNRREFHDFMRRYFGKTGQAFVNCMKNCAKHRHHDKCPRDLKCGVKKLSHKEFHEKSAECHKKQSPRRHEICSCLKEAGMDDLNCNFNEQENSSTTQRP